MTSDFRVGHQFEFYGKLRIVKDLDFETKNVILGIGDRYSHKAKALKRFADF